MRGPERTQTPRQAELVAGVFLGSPHAGPWPVNQSAHFRERCAARVMRTPNPSVRYSISMQRTIKIAALDHRMLLTEATRTVLP